MKRILIGLIAVLFCSFAIAATTPNSIITAQTPNRGILQFLPASTPGTYLTLYTAGANGSKCYGGFASSTDVASHLINIALVNTSINYNITAFTLVASAGNVAGTPPQAIFTQALVPGLPIDSDGNSYIMLVSGDTLKATYATAVTASDAVNLVITCVDF